MPSLSTSISLSKAFLCEPYCVCACMPLCVCARVRVCVCGLHDLFQHFCPPATSLYIMFCELIQSPKANFKKKRFSSSCSSWSKKEEKTSCCEIDLIENSRSEAIINIKACLHWTFDLENVHAQWLVAFQPLGADLNPRPELFFQRFRLTYYLTYLFRKDL